MDKKDNRSSEREPEGNSFDYEELVNEPAEDQDYEEYREEDDFDEDEEVVFRFRPWMIPVFAGMMILAILICIPLWKLSSHSGGAGDSDALVTATECFLHSACQRVHRSSVQATAGITQTTYALSTQNMRIDARALWRHVGTDADCAPRPRIHEFECAVIQIAAAAGQKRIYVLHHRRLNQFKAVYLKKVEAFASHRLEYASFARQNIREMLRNKPTDHMF